MRCGQRLRARISSIVRMLVTGTSGSIAEISCRSRAVMATGFERARTMRFALIAISAFCPCVMYTTGSGSGSMLRCLIVGATPTTVAS
jgi:hypothetical protein